MSRVLIDTNVFIYAYDPADPAKHETAVQLIDHQVAVVYTEDFQNERVVEGVRFVNPFHG